MKNKAMEIMKQREMMINEAQTIIAEARETLVVLGAEEMQATVVTNEIVINKGKVVEVPTTKEVVIDNTDTATIEMLRETIRQMNENINDMNKQIEELKEDNMHKELLLNDFRETTDRLIKERNELSDKVEEQDLEIIALEEQNAFLTGKVTGLQNELKEEKANVKTVYIEVEDEVFEEETTEEVVVKETKEEVKPAANYHKNVDIALHDVHKTHDGVRGRTDRYEFAWAIGKKLPAYKLDGDKAWRPMTGNMYPEAKYIMSTLSNFMEQVKKQKETKAKKVTTNKPQAKTTKPVVDEQEVVLEQPKTSGPNLNNIGKTVTVKAEDVLTNNTKEDPLAGVEEYDFF